MKAPLKIGLALLGMTTLGTLAAFAARPDGNDALLTSHARISMTRAVQLAEQQVAGRAVRAELEASRKGWIYDVEVVADRTTYDVAVDAARGKVLAATLDQTDSDDRQDRQD